MLPVLSGSYVHDSSTLDQVRLAINIKYYLLLFSKNIQLVAAVDRGGSKGAVSHGPQTAIFSIANNSVKQLLT